MATITNKVGTLGAAGAAVLGLLLVFAPPAGATNQCAMRGQINATSSGDMVYVNEPALTCDGGAISHTYKTSSGSATFTTGFDWNWINQGTTLWGGQYFDVPSAKGKSWNGSSSGAVYSNPWTITNIWWTWG